MQNIRRLAVADLDRAIETAEGTAIHDPIYRYIRARLCHDTAMAAPQLVQVNSPLTTGPGYVRSPTATMSP